MGAVSADRARVQQILMDLKRDPANGIREVWTSADLASRGSHPDAAFGLDVVDGFYTSGGFDGYRRRRRAGRATR